MGKNQLTIRRLLSGGLITNYRCNHIRTLLAIHHTINTRELQLVEYYRQKELL